MTIIAQWTVELWGKCPNCLEEVDLVTADDFWNGRNPIVESAETGGIDVECPKCGHEFLAKGEF